MYLPNTFVFTKRQKNMEMYVEGSSVSPLAIECQSKAYLAPGCAPRRS